MEIKFIILFIIIFLGFSANICDLIKNLYDTNPWKVLFKLFICVLHLLALIIICIKMSSKEEEQLNNKKETVIIIKVNSNNPSDTLKTDTLNTTDLQILVNK